MFNFSTSLLYPFKLPSCLSKGEETLLTHSKATAYNLVL